MFNPFATEAKAPHGSLMSTHSRKIILAEGFFFQKKQKAITGAAQDFKLLCLFGFLFP